MKKSILILLSVLLVSLSACGETANQPEEPTKGEIKTVKINKLEVTQIGRTFENGDLIWFTQSGDGIEFDFTGSSLKASFIGDGIAEKNAARVKAFVDGKAVLDFQMGREREQTILDLEKPETHRIRIVKVSESRLSTIAVESLTHDGTVQAVPERALSIEFIGDSITAGYGVDSLVEPKTYCAATQDCTRAYAYLCADLLDADYSIFAISGFGVVSGKSDNGNKNSANTIPLYYEKYGFFPSNTQLPGPALTGKWSFRKEMDYVVVNLGTNDVSYCIKGNGSPEEYSEAYVKFLKQLREKNPKAHILCTLGIYDDYLCEDVNAAVEAYRAETNDENVSYFRLSKRKQLDGAAIDNHPTDVTYKRAAEELANEIKRLENEK